MNITEHLLVCLSEECVEVAKEVSKALRFGACEIMLGQPLTNAERIAKEFQEVLAIVEMLEERGVLQRPTDIHAIARKKKRVEEYMQYAISIGSVES